MAQIIERQTVIHPTSSSEAIRGVLDAKELTAEKVELLKTVLRHERKMAAESHAHQLAVLAATVGQLAPMGTAWFAMQTAAAQARVAEAKLEMRKIDAEDDENEAHAQLREAGGVRK